jgi:ABC-type Fe3+-hydroxamate transport system substrate-binding protein
MDLGVEPVGVTKFCVHPDGLHRRVKRIGGTKQVDVKGVRELKPDLVIACREENVKEQVEALNVPVLLTDASTVEGAWKDMIRIAEAVDRAAFGRDWVERIREAWGAPRTAEWTAAYAIWCEPWMVAGGDTYIHDVLRWWGVANAFAELPRYPEVAGWSVADIVLLSSEPYPFREAHVNSLREAGQTALLVNGEAFSWYGSRMLHAVQDLRDLRSDIARALSPKT